MEDSEDQQNILTSGPTGVARPTGRAPADAHKELSTSRSFRRSFEDLLGRTMFKAASSARLRQHLFNALRLSRASVNRLQSFEELHLLAYIFNNVARSHSQILQDLWVCYELREMREGYFVEFGATNGITNSNSALLEREYGWGGLLAEPNPVWHPDLRRNRRAAIDERCVAARTGETVEFLAVEEAELGTMAAYAAQDHFADIRNLAPRIPVETVSLDDLLAAHQAPSTIDYMSIDTEGSEYEILSVFDFNRWHVRLFSIEHNYTKRETDIDALLSRRGYRRVFREFSQWDAWYRAEDDVRA
jgi:FkbM family methyltransferase